MPLAHLTVAHLQAFLLWGAALNYAVLLFGVLAWTLAGDRLYRLHARFFAIGQAEANAAVYLMLGLYKLGIWLLFLIPWLALRLAT
jgi:hypothetical protein